MDVMNQANNDIFDPSTAASGILEIQQAVPTFDGRADSLTPTAADLLIELQRGPASAYQLAYVLNVPQASVRRCVGELRKAGYNVPHITQGDQYRLF